MPKKKKSKLIVKTTQDKRKGQRSEGFDKHPENINRKGRPPMSKYIKQLKEYSANEIIETYGKVVSMTAAEAMKWLSKPECTLTEYTLIRNMLAGKFQDVLDRVIGRIPEKGTLDINTTSKISDEEFQAAINKHLEEHGRGNGK